MNNLLTKFLSLSVTEEHRHLLSRQHRQVEDDVKTQRLPVVICCLDQYITIFAFSVFVLILVFACIKWVTHQC